MMTWIDEQIAFARSADMQAAERRRMLVQLAVGARPMPPRFYGPVLAQLGRQLARWGAGIEARYSPPIVPLAVGPCEGCPQ